MAIKVKVKPTSGKVKFELFSIILYPIITSYCTIAYRYAVGCTVCVRYDVFYGIRLKRYDKNLPSHV